MRIVLINPGDPDRRILGAYDRASEAFAPHGLAYLAAVLRADGHDIAAIDQFAARHTTAQLVDSIVREKPDFIGFSCLSPDYPALKKTTAALRSAGVTAPIVAGNLHATLFHEQIIAEQVADYVVRGEAELPIVELARSLAAGNTEPDIPGVSYAGHLAAELATPPDLDNLPFPAWDLFPLHLYLNPPLFRFQKTMLAVQTSRGCPYNCYFCCQNAMVPHVRRRQVEGVVDEIEANLDQHGVDFFWFSDAIFPLSKQYGHEIADEMIRRNLHRRVQWVTECRVDSADLELLRHLREAGLLMIIFGFEVGNQDVLDRIKPGATLAAARQVMKATRQVGIQSLGLYMIGLPGETEQSIRQTIDLAISLDTDFAKFNRAIPYPGSCFYTEMHDRLHNPDDYALYNPWLNAPDIEPLYVPENLTHRRLVRLQNLAMRRFYLRPRKILRLLLSRRVRMEHAWRGLRALLEGLRGRR
ncbi:MAG: radical SAM protein [Candidatus Lernaella stagnicola]|nr:radical SAM protein [Candidatus Lernaella stagnicola]